MAYGMQQNIMGIPSNNGFQQDYFNQQINNSMGAGPQQPVNYMGQDKYMSYGSAMPVSYPNASTSDNTSNGLWGSLKGMFEPSMAGAKSPFELGAGGVSALASLWSAYNQNNYQNKMSDMYKQQQDFYQNQVNRQNQRQDAAQAAYNKSQGM